MKSIYGAQVRNELLTQIIGNLKSMAVQEVPRVLEHFISQRLQEFFQEHGCGQAVAVNLAGKFTKTVRRFFLGSSQGKFMPIMSARSRRFYIHPLGTTPLISVVPI
jgi:hypothetical protein